MLTGIMMDYATAAAIETFTASKYERHPTEIAAFRGARAVTASETEQGRTWAESRINSPLTKWLFRPGDGHSPF